MTQLPFVVGYVFMVAAETEKFGESIKPKDKIESLMLKKASETVHGFIEREGGVECDKLKKTRVFRSRNEHSALNLKGKRRDSVL